LFGCHGSSGGIVNRAQEIEGARLDQQNRVIYCFNGWGTLMSAIMLDLDKWRSKQF